GNELPWRGIAWRESCRSPECAWPTMYHGEAVLRPPRASAAMRGAYDDGTPASARRWEMRMEATNTSTSVCPACGQSDIEPAGRVRQFDLQRCRACDLRFVPPCQVVAVEYDEL